MENYVFISYSTKNQLEADALRQLLIDNGISTWMAPGDIPAGSKYAQVISKAVKNCACFILLLSENAQNSVWVAKETERAVNYRKPIIPVQIEDVRLNEEFEMYISTDQIVAVPKIDNSSSEIRKLIQGISPYLSLTVCESEDTHLQMKNTNDSNCRFELVHGSFIVGADKRKCTFFIDDNMVSKIHAIIDVTDRCITIKDLNTTNGTLVNGKRIASNTEIEIKANDTLQFGNSEFVLTCFDVSVGKESRIDSPETQSMLANRTIGIGVIIENTYRITAMLGKGVLGTVFLAEHIRTKKKWTIKCFDKKHKDIAHISKRTLVETGILNNMSHPGLPTIADILETSDMLFVVMDYIEGTPLSSIIANHGAQPESTVIEWFKQLCSTMNYLHSRQPAVIHNDIHPQNIMLRPDGKLIMIDFGSSFELAGSGEDTLLLGTTFFAAPEKYNGVVDTRTDIYALGMTMYSLLTGHDPSKPPYTLSSLREISPNVSLGLESIIEKCLERNPDDRYQKIDEILYELDNIEQVNARLRKDTIWERLFRVKRK
ncbi:protein kinase domain-containing protein [Hominenteromicrobium sp.]|uniref:protein kinase domain-containing protein n=1 Tax=Hominenteromicrobium sp. TaxID=3073581 RepID=UPI003AB8F324